jgi:hypothetical protein
MIAFALKCAVLALWTAAMATLAGQTVDQCRRHRRFGLIFWPYGLLACRTNPNHASWRILVASRIWVGIEIQHPIV